MAAAGQDGESPQVAASDSRGVRHRVEHGIEAAKGKYAGSSAEHLWGRLDSLDFINRGMLFAATLLLCFFPFLIVAEAVTGRSAPSALAQHLGMDKQAAADVGHLFTSSAATASVVTGTSWVWFILAGIAVATTFQQMYERIFELKGRGTRDMPRRLAWLVVFVVCSYLAGVAWAPLSSALGPVLLAVIALVALTGFWWFTMWFLLAGKIPWKDLLPSAVATAVCWLGMEIVFSVIFSGMVISYYRQDGPIGVVFALMSWLIAIGVVVILGAVTGIVWRERNLSFRAAFNKLRRNPSAPQTTKS